MSSSSDDDDDNFLRVHAMAIAQALQERDADGPSTASSSTGSQSRKERLIRETYIALCYDDPQVESDLACHYLAAALVDPKSPYALSGPLVEGVRQLCSKVQATTAADAGTTTNNNNITQQDETEDDSLLQPPQASASTAKGYSALAWTVYARIPLLCCQASKIEDVHPYLGSYRPPPPPLVSDEANDANDSRQQQERQDHADRIVADMLGKTTDESHPDDTAPAPAPALSNREGVEEEEKWADESDPSDFEFESGLDYQQQQQALDQEFAAWMVDRTDPIKLSQPPCTEPTTWKHVRHAVMDLISQLSYRHVAPMLSSPNSSSSLSPAEFLTQLTLTLLVPPTTTTTRTVAPGPSLFDCPDEDQHAQQPQRQLQSMAWYPMWVLRDAAATQQLQVPPLAQYLTLLQTLLSVDAATDPRHKTVTTTSSKSSNVVAPATYAGLAALSALCQQVVLDSHSATTTRSNASQQDTNNSNISNHRARVERFRALQLVLWESCDDLAHVLEKEATIMTKKSATNETVNDNVNDNDNTKEHGWIVWTLLPLWEVLCNVSFRTGTTLIPKATEGVIIPAQLQQRWAAWLQSGLLRQWLLRLQQTLDYVNACESNKTGSSLYNNIQWQLVRRSLLFLLAQSSVYTSTIAKYAWRFPGFAGLVKIGTVQDQDAQANEDIADPVDDLLWNLLAMELAETSPAAPTVQWKTKTSTNALTAKSLPSRDDCWRAAWAGFQQLCDQVVQQTCKESGRATTTSTTTNGSESPLETTSSLMSKRKKRNQSLHRALQNIHRFVDCLVSCPLLATLFAHGLTMGKSAGAENITSILDSIQEALSRYKAPPSSQDADKHGVQQKCKNSHKDNDDFDETYDFDSLHVQQQAKAQSISATLQEEIHSVRKAMKVLRSLLANTPAPTTSSCGTLVVHSVDAKTD